MGFYRKPNRVTHGVTVATASIGAPRQPGAQTRDCTKVFRRAGAAGRKERRRDVAESPARAKLQGQLRACRPAAFEAGRPIDRRANLTGQLLDACLDILDRFAIDAAQQPKRGRRQSRGRFTQRSFEDSPCGAATASVCEGTATVSLTIWVAPSAAASRQDASKSFACPPSTKLFSYRRRSQSRRRAEEGSVRAPRGSGRQSRPCRRPAARAPRPSRSPAPSINPAAWPVDRGRRRIPRPPIRRRCSPRQPRASDVRRPERPRRRAPGCREDLPRAIGEQLRLCGLLHEATRILAQLLGCGSEDGSHAGQSATRSNISGC